MLKDAREAKKSLRVVLKKKEWNHRRREKDQCSKRECNPLREVWENMRGSKLSS